jgi:hypothetical protein
MYNDRKSAIKRENENILFEMVPVQVTDIVILDGKQMRTTNHVRQYFRHATIHIPEIDIKTARIHGRRCNVI